MSNGDFEPTVVENALTSQWPATTKGLQLLIEREMEGGQGQNDALVNIQKKFQRVIDDNCSIGSACMGYVEVDYNSEEAKAFLEGDAADIDGLITFSCDVIRDRETPISPEELSIKRQACETCLRNASDGVLNFLERIGKHGEKVAATKVAAIEAEEELYDIEQVIHKEPSNGF
jgi:hypothetical protein